MSTSQLVVPATEYSPLPPPEERFNSYAYGWCVSPKPEPLRIKEQLPKDDHDELARLWEETEKEVAKYRYPDQEDFKNAERQMGKFLHSSELVMRIQKLNANLIVEDSNSMKGCAAFYWTDGKGKKYTNASFTKGYVPEFTVMKTDSADLPAYYPTYGWRTVLVRLLKFRALTWQQVLDTFGDVKFSDSRGKHWRNNVKDFRT
jgi:hypothetical protein